MGVGGGEGVPRHVWEGGGWRGARSRICLTALATFMLFIGCSLPWRGVGIARCVGDRKLEAALHVLEGEFSLLIFCC